MSTHADLKTVTDLQLPRYLGTWYEIARLPMSMNRMTAPTSAPTTR